MSLLIPADGTQTKPPVEMRNWRLFPDSEFKALVLYGVNCHTRFLVNTSPIAERLAGDLVRTRAGTTIRLVGPLRRLEIESVFSCSFLDLFQNGFPENWLDLVEKELERLANASNRAEITRLVDELSGRKLTCASLNAGSSKNNMLSPPRQIPDPQLPSFRSGQKRVSLFSGVEPELSSPAKRLFEMEIAEELPQATKQTFFDTLLRSPLSTEKAYEKGKNRQKEPMSESSLSESSEIVEEGEKESSALAPGSSKAKVTARKSRGRTAGTGKKFQRKKNQDQSSPEFGGYHLARFLYGNMSKRIGSPSEQAKTLFKRQKNDEYRLTSSDDSDHSIFGIDEEGTRRKLRKKPPPKKKKIYEGPKNKPGPKKKLGPEKPKKPKKPKKIKIFKKPRIPPWLVAPEEAEAPPATLENQEGNLLQISKEPSQTRIRKRKLPFSRKVRNIDISKLKTVKKYPRQKLLSKKSVFLTPGITRRLSKLRKKRLRRQKPLKKVDISKLKSVKKKVKKVGFVPPDPVILSENSDYLPSELSEDEQSETDQVNDEEIDFELEKYPKSRGMSWTKEQYDAIYQGVKKLGLKGRGKWERIRSAYAVLRSRTNVDIRTAFYSLKRANEPRTKKRRREIKLWDAAEYRAIKEGIQRFGLGKWREIQRAYPCLAKRSNIDVRDAWGRLVVNPKLSDENFVHWFSKRKYDGK